MSCNSGEGWAYLKQSYLKRTNPELKNRTHRSCVIFDPPHTGRASLWVRFSVWLSTNGGQTGANGEARPLGGTSVFEKLKQAERLRVFSAHRNKNCSKMLRLCWRPAGSQMFSASLRGRSLMVSWGTARAWSWGRRRMLRPVEMRLAYPGVWEKA